MTLEDAIRIAWQLGGIALAAAVVWFVWNSTTE